MSASLFSTLTPEQQQRLASLARQHGRLWRSKLRQIWDRGEDERDPLLRQIRNNVGPADIERIKTSELAPVLCPIHNADAATCECAGAPPHQANEETA